MAKFLAALTVLCRAMLGMQPRVGGARGARACCGGRCGNRLTPRLIWPYMGSKIGSAMMGATCAAAQH